MNKETRPQKNDYERRLERVLHYSYANLDGDLSLDRLAEVACMSRFHWHRVFVAQTGETVAAFVRRLRIAKASHLLCRSDKDLAQIARICGYPSAQSFSHIFTRIVGQSPGQFRKNGKVIEAHLQQAKRRDEMFDVTFADHPAYRAAAIPHQGDYLEIGKAFETLAMKMGARGLIGPQSQMFGVYYCDPSEVPKDELQSAACMAVDAGFEPGDGLEVVELAAGRYAEIIYTGPYANLPPVYEWFYGSWLPESGQELRDGPPVEIYLNNPADTAPKDLQTKICIPVAAS